MALLPHTAPYFVIEQIGSHQYSLKVGGSVSSTFEQFQPINSSLWMASFANIDFNGISLGKQNVVLETTEYEMKIPSKAFFVIKDTLVRNYLCTLDQSYIYCPCSLGINRAFPTFMFSTANSTYQILP